MAKKKVVKKKSRRKTSKKKVTRKITKKKVSKKPGPPAYFISLSVENVRCFGPKQTIDLTDRKGRLSQWTVLLGDNNTGKSTLLECFVALEPSILRLGHEKEFRVTRYFSSRSNRRWNLHRKFGEQQLRISGSVCHGAKIKEMKKISTKENLSMSISYQGRPPEFAQGTCSLGQTKNMGNLVCYGYGASRAMGTTTLSDKKPEEASASLFADEVDLVNAEEWLLQADYAASKSSKIKSKAIKRRDQVKDILVHLLPEVEDIRFTKPVEKQPKPGVEFKTPYGWVTLDGLSLGYKTLISWMVDFANRMFERYPRSNNPLNEPAIVLVDEIDLHLHPKWQRTIMNYLSERFVNTQFIVTAHSPLVVQSVTDVNVALLRREGDHVIIDNNPQAIKGWRADQILTSDLFGLPTARSVKIEKLQIQRRKILSKAKLTKTDQGKLRTIEHKMGELPTAETPVDIEAMKIIRGAAKSLKKRRSSKP